MANVTLKAACEATAVSAQTALAWVSDPANDPRVGHERAFLERNLRNSAYQAKRLAASVDRPMCIGVFGPSQAGKSYLVSVLARRGETLSALFDDATRPEIDFISEINPYGEKEATGLVTRFSIHRIATPKGYPVALRLLTQSDILKILLNSYYFDVDLQQEAEITAADIEAHISQFANSGAAAPYADVLREEDIWDTEEYCQRQIKRSEIKIFAPYWDRIAGMAPRLPLGERAHLFSILWGRHEPLTNLYLTLVESLAKIGFKEDVFCPLSALLPATSSILNVETLAGLGQPDTEFLEVSTAGGGTVSLPKPVVTALAAELRMVLKDQPWPFFEHTDLLDFPGYRSRTQHDLRRYLRDAQSSALKELFLRGKVDYLFQRYTAEQELTSMLLCLRPSNLDVTTLPAVIEEWIGVTHGRTAAERTGRPVLLFFLLTMFDQHLAEKAGDEGADPGLRFQARLEASLLKPFAKVSDSWPLNWTPGRAFDNCFWIRNPNYKAEGIILYEGRNEVSVHDHKVARIAELRAAYAKVPEVNAHFREPLKAFDEVMRLNDGGISYLAGQLAAVCRPGMKQEQVRARLHDIRQRLVSLLAPHYISTDADQRLAERTAVARAVIDDFGDCVQRHAFGSFQRALCVDRLRLTDALYEARTQRQDRLPEVAAGGNGKSGKPGLFDDIFGGAAAGATGAGPRPAAPQGLGFRASRTEALARSAMQTWAEFMHETADDTGFATSVFLRPATLKEVVVELVATARRLNVEGAIRRTLDGISHLEAAEHAVQKATIVAERHINGFVTTLAADASARPVAFDASGIGGVAAPFQRDYVVQWLRRFYDHVQINAQSADGLVHDPAQNARLGVVIEGLRA